MIRTTYPFLAAVFMGAWCMAQTPEPPNLDAQRVAMRKLDFLVGEWAGEATVLRAQGQFEELVQSESARFRLDGLVLVIEGVGRAKADARVVLQALGLISFDDETGTYRMRAFNDGRWLETEVKLLDSERAIVWGFALGDIKTSTVLRMNEKGEWTEQGELTVGNRPPQKMIDLTVRRRIG
jgi:hypothetical protein